MMTQCFPDNLALITSGFELAFSLSLMVGSELGGYLYDKSEFWVPINVTSKKNAI
jgi:predicted MFS family arabinose efflux permease